MHGWWTKSQRIRYRSGRTPLSEEHRSRLCQRSPMSSPIRRRPKKRRRYSRVSGRSAAVQPLWRACSSGAPIQTCSLAICSMQTRRKSFAQRAPCGMSCIGQTKKTSSPCAGYCLTMAQQTPLSTIAIGNGGFPISSTRRRGSANFLPKGKCF